MASSFFNGMHAPSSEPPAFGIPLSSLSSSENMLCLFFVGLEGNSTCLTSSIYISSSSNDISFSFSFSFIIIFGLGKRVNQAIVTKQMTVRM